jgi:cyclophilin family peptidyl-prolyl cis-trans isomerase
MKLVMGMMAVLAITAPALARKPKLKPLPISIPMTAMGPTATPDTLWHLDLSTGGSVIIALRPDKAPNHVNRIRTLTRAGFYDGVIFHRVIEGFMAQTGDPKGTGEGGSSLPNLNAEFNDLPHLRGSVSMARAESVNSANSQFFIVFLPVMRLDGKYTVIGRVTQGIQYVDAVPRGEPPEAPARVVHAWIEADGPNAAKVPLPAPVAVLTPPATPMVPATPVPVPVPPVVTPPAPR